MHIRLLAFLLLSCLSQAFGQSYLKESNNWYFGFHAGLHFLPGDSTGRPQALSDDVLLEASEGTCTASDTAGNLLFYVGTTTDFNSAAVLNRRHQVMPHGDSIYGGSSSSQNAIAIRKPGSMSEYYVFSVAQLESQGTDPQGMYWTHVDMALDSGRGDVDSIRKNVPVMSRATEKITAVLHSNGRWVWVLAHQLYTNRFVAVLVTDTGVSAQPVVSAAGLWHLNPAADTMPGEFINKDIARGCMKLSPSGEYVGVALTEPVGGAHYLQVLRFDDQTGQVSQPVTVAMVGAYSFGFYGVEFSPDNSKVYFADRQRRQIHQFDLMAGDSAAFVQSMVNIPSIDEPTCLQLGLDGRLYVSHTNFPGRDIDYLQYPNLKGVAAVGYVQDGIPLDAGTYADRGLNNVNQSMFMALNRRSASRLAGPALACAEGSDSLRLALAGVFAPGTRLEVFASDTSGSFGTESPVVGRLTLPFISGTDTVYVPLDLSGLPTGSGYRLGFRADGNPRFSMHDTAHALAVLNIRDSPLAISTISLTADSHACYRLPLPAGARRDWLVQGGQIVSQDADSVVVAWTSPTGLLQAAVAAGDCRDTLSLAYVTAARPRLSLAGRLFPQPTTGPASLELGEALTAPARLEVIDASGRRVYSHTIEAGTRQLALPSVSWAAGLYAVRLQSATVSGAWRLERQ